jgi:hypothetical protein
LLLKTSGRPCGGWLTLPRLRLLLFLDGPAGARRGGRFTSPNLRLLLLSKEKRAPVARLSHLARRGCSAVEPGLGVARDVSPCRDWQQFGRAGCPHLSGQAGLSGNPCTDRASGQAVLSTRTRTPRGPVRLPKTRVFWRTDVKQHGRRRQLRFQEQRATPIRTGVKQHAPRRERGRQRVSQAGVAERSAAVRV